MVRRVSVLERGDWFSMVEGEAVDFLRWGDSVN